MTLNEIAKKMCAKGKGILAADESTGTIAKRFKSINVENIEKNRLNFRQTLFNSSAMKDFIGGVILFDETIRQQTTLGTSIPELISKHGAVPGIKVDKGAKPLAGSSDETVTEGLDGLRERLKEYYDLGARFTKWRAVYKISDKFPSAQSIKSNAHALARYAALVQEAKMVPIVEPEVLMDGSHNIDGADKLNEFLKIKRIKPIVLFGMLNNKKASLFLNKIKKRVSKVLAIKIPDEDNAFKTKQIKEICDFHSIKCEQINNINDALKYFRFHQEKIYLITGSLYLIGKIRKKLL